MVLIKTGHLACAEKICEDAKKLENCDKGIMKTLEFIEEIKINENKEETKALKDIPQIVSLLIDFRKCASKTKLLDGQYTFSRNNINYNLVVKKNKINGLYEYKENQESIHPGIFPKKETKKIIEIMGKVIGQAILFTEKEQQENQSLISFDIKNQGVVIFSDNMEKVTYAYLPKLKLQEDIVLKSPYT